MLVLMRMCKCITYQPGIFFNRLSPGLHITKTKLTTTQTQRLMETFEANAYPKIERMDHLAMSLNITKKKVENWFGYMRRKKVAKGLLKKGE